MVSVSRFEVRYPYTLILTLIPCFAEESPGSAQPPIVSPKSQYMHADDSDEEGMELGEGILG